MNNIKEGIIQHCLNILKRKDVKHELKNMMKPLLTMILQELYPYIFLSLIFVIISFLLILGIFLMLLKNSKVNIKQLI